MAALANTQNTYQTIGNREDLENRVYKIAADKTPFTSNIGNDKATATYHEWQTSSLPAPNAANAQVQGDEYVNGASIITARPGNRTQIMRQVGSVSGTQESVIHAGISSEKAFQILYKGEALATDWEARCLGNFASAAGNATTAATSAGAQAWFTSNVSRGAGGASGGFSGGVVAAATAGTARAFTETLLKDVVAQCFSNGAKPTQLYVSAKHKQVFSTFAGIALNRREVRGKEQAVVIGGADVYVSDFGDLTVIPVQYGLADAALLIDPEHWATATLRPMQKQDLAKTGDAERFAIVMEKTLVARNEKSSGVIADLS